MDSLLSRYKKVHCIGVGGIGISAIAKFLSVKGKIVTGSDATKSNITEGVEKLGVHVFIGHDAKNVTDDIDLIVYSEAVPDDNVERARAKELGIPQLGHFDFLGELSKEYRTICVTGTNGKSTTTAMTGKIFEKAGLDPTVFVGTLVPGFELGNLRVGKSDILIVEGDEYKRKMLKLHPETTLVTNIEEDHLDVYKDWDDIDQAFHRLALLTSQTVFRNTFEISYGDHWLEGRRPQLKYFGDELILRKLPKTIFNIFRSRVTKKERIVSHGEQRLDEIVLKIPGEFNMMNALAAKAIAEEYGISFDIIKKTLAEFPGVWRRFERVGTFNDAEIISDYGHHPTAIKGTIEAAKEFFPGRRIVLCFQPHQHSRTKALFDDFVQSFKGADLLILPEIYHVEGRNEEEGKISSKDFLQFYPNAIFVGDLSETEETLRSTIEPNDVVLIMGAGNIDEVARRLVQ